MFRTLTALVIAVAVAPVAAYAAPSNPPSFEVFGPDTSKTVKQGTVTSSLALRNLREFLDATNWSCLYGLNLGQGTVENAVREAAAADKIILWIRETKGTATDNDPKLIVINTRSGAIATYNVDTTGGDLYSETRTGQTSQ